jgi:hypothetical protein
MSMKPFIRGGTGREWRSGRFNLINPPALTGSAFRKKRWGTVCLEGTIETHPYISASYIDVPEGLLLVSTCARCGGRGEHLFDLRFVPDAARGHRACLDHHDSAERFMDAHMACSTEPLQQILPSPLKPFLSALESAARTEIRKGRQFPPAICVVTTDVRCFAYSLTNIDAYGPRSTDRLNELTSRAAAMREYIRARNLDVLAAATVSEVWSREPSPDQREWVDDDPRRFLSSPTSERSEALAIWVVTTSAAFGGFAPITRMGGVINEGPGRVGDLDWMTCGDAPIFNGLLATDVAF